MQSPFAFDTDPRAQQLLQRLTSLARGKELSLSDDPLCVLAHGILCDGLASAVATGIFRQIWSRYQNWRSIREADVAELSTFLVGIEAPERRINDLHGALDRIEGYAGQVDLGFLRGMPTDTALNWLQSLSGVSTMTACAVLSFSSLRQNIFVIGTEEARVARRLGLCGPNTPLSAVPREMSERVPNAWRQDDFKRFSQGLGRLARTSCGPEKNRCQDCLLADLCPSAQRKSADVIPFRPSSRAQPTRMPSKNARQSDERVLTITGRGTQNASVHE